MTFFIIPEKITITVGLDDRTIALIDAIINVFGQKKRVEELIARLNKSADSLAGTVAANPDPDPKD